MLASAIMWFIIIHMQGEFHIDVELKARIRAAGLGYRDLANVLGEKPNTVCQRLNGWLILDAERRRKIEDRIDQENQKAVAAS